MLWFFDVMIRSLSFHVFAQQINMYHWFLLKCLQAWFWFCFWKKPLCKFVEKLCSEVFSPYTTLSLTRTFDCVYECRELLATFLQLQSKSTDIEVAWKSIFIMNIPVCCVSPMVSNWIPTSHLILGLNRERNRVVKELNRSRGTFL